jgi:hypothetical protein
MYEDERPQPEAGGAADGSRQDHSTAPLPAAQDPKDPGPVPIREKLAWSLDDISALTDLSKRLLQRGVSAGRMPRPDLKVCRRALWRPATIMGWLDELADRQGRRSRP